MVKTLLLSMVIFNLNCATLLPKEQVIVATFKGNTFELSIDDAEISNFNPEVPITIKIKNCNTAEITQKINGVSNKVTLKNESAVIAPLSKDQINSIIKNKSSYTISIDCKGNNNIIKNIEIGKSSFVSSNSSEDKGGSTKEDSDIGADAHTFFSTHPNTKNAFRMDSYHNDHVYLFFDERGQPLKRIPVNVDEDDLFTIYIRVRESEQLKYSINIEGDYSPTDLSIRTYELIDSITLIQSKGEDKWTYLKYECGPFTSNFTFSFNYAVKENEIKTLGAVNKIKINKLYHVGVGASFVKSSLPNPDYILAPLNDTVNTIIALNNSSRALLTFNVIWYWNLFKGNPSKGSSITGGRDILKEDAFLSLQRLFPTFGVSLDKNFKQNFFLGGVYEFARGGSVIFGGHFGSVKSLANKQFELGKTQFIGKKEDILITNEWKLGWFVGINVDTRIFNALFRRGM